MVKKHYKNQGIMKFLTIIGALVGIVYLILRLTAIGTRYQIYSIPLGINFIAAIIIGFAVAIITLLAGIKPNNPIPFNWIMLFILAVLMIIFVDIIAGVLVLIAFLIGLIEEL